MMAKRSSSCKVKIDKLVIKDFEKRLRASVDDALVEAARRPWPSKPRSRPPHPAARFLTSKVPLTRKSRPTPAPAAESSLSAPGSARVRGGIVCYPSGRHVSPLEMGLNDIDILDIAHALSQVNRFGGHLPRPVSVAQHSVYVSRLCEGPHALQALLHDASEAYLGDVTKWLKATPEFAAYRKAEERLQCLIWQKFGCATRQAPEVSAADKLMVRYEAWTLLGPDMPLFLRPDYPIPSGEEIYRVGAWRPWRWSDAREDFLVRFRELTGWTDLVGAFD